jgi:predicted Zn-dependent protease
LAIKHAETAERLSPRSQTASPSYVIGAALFLAHRFDEAVPKLLLAIREVPSFPTPYRYLAACYAHLGQLNEARRQSSAFEQSRLPTFPRLRIRCADLRREAVSECLQRLRETIPESTVATVMRDVVKAMSPELTARIIDGLRKAGLPEG